LGPDRVEIALGAAAKKPGPDMIGRDIELEVCNTGDEEVGAYERLIGAALHADPSLFAREDGVLEAWRIVDPLLDTGDAPHEYAPGSPGPEAADELVAVSGGWRAVQNAGGPRTPDPGC
jgi:glucose-6-phosphate 1-dehydrogenase